MSSRTLPLLVALGVAGCSASTRQTSSQVAGLGRSDMSISCADDARAPFVRGVLALHSFFYDQAKTEFERAVTIDRKCAMGYWGMALANGEQLWSWQDTTESRSAIAQAVALRAQLTPKEVALVDSAAILVGREGDERPPQARVRMYVDELRRMHERWPADDDIATFFALGLLSVEDPVSLRDRMQAGAISLEVLARNPKHPGALHYAIHAFDDPEHAVLALPAALSYAAVAPEAPHARHMPSHIFVELGYWAEAAASCESAWQVSLARASRLKQTADRGDLHSLSWLPSIYAQLGQRARADEALQTYANIVSSHGVAPLAFIAAAFSVARDTDRWDKLDEQLTLIQTALPAIEARFPQKSPDRPPIPLLVRASRAAALAIATARRHDAASARRYELEMRTARAEAEKVAPGYVAAKTYQTAARAAALRVAAEIAAAETDVAAAQDALGQLMSIEPAEFASDGAYPGRATACERLGEIELEAGRAREAAEHLACALEETPGRSRALGLAAQAADRLGDRARAADLRYRLARNWAHADAR